MWVVMEVQRFEVKQTLPLKVVLDFAPMCGYLPVYESKEDAMKDFPEGPFQEIRCVTATDYRMEAHNGENRS